MLMGKIRTKRELAQALNQSDVAFLEEREVVSDRDIRALAEQLRSLIRHQKRIHVSILERGCK